MDALIGRAMTVAVDSARAAGQILREMLQTAEVREKAPKDLVTDADIASQLEIERRVRADFPTHGFIGEENAAQGFSEPPSPDVWTWVVDPLDGTANYAHRLPNFAVSIGLVYQGKTVLGVVFDPMADELYSAILGQGAKLNGRTIQCSRCTQLDRSLIAASFPPQVQRDSVEIEQFIEILLRSQSVRRLGSAALNLCFVAHGRLDGYWAKELKPWDVSAGSLIASEAGAVLTNLQGADFSVWKGEVLTTATNDLHREMLLCLSSIRSKHESR